MENESYKQTPRWKQRLYGLFLILVSAGFIVWTWRTALYEGYYYLKAALVFPMFLFVGLGVLILPDYKAERVNRGEDISRLEGFKLITARWWAVLIIAILAGLGNMLLLRRL